jgi:hypothetical protein
MTRDGKARSTSRTQWNGAPDHTAHSAYAVAIAPREEKG